MAKQVLDLYELYNLVVARGGLVDVINKKLWQEIIKGLHLPSSITSAAFTLRTQYVSCLFFLSSSSSIFRSGVSRWSSANAKKTSAGTLSDVADWLDSHGPMGSERKLSFPSLIGWRPF